MSGNDDIHLWAYGSLMWTSSLLDTLESRSDPPPARIAEVRGWRRAWNCLSARTYALDDGRGRVRRVVLGLVADPSAVSTGVLYRLATSELNSVRKRERAYDEVDITDLLCRPVDGRAVTFVPRTSHRRDANESRLTLGIDRDYLDGCLRGADEHGLAGVRHELERLADLPLFDAPMTYAVIAPGCE